MKEWAESTWGFSDFIEENPMLTNGGSVSGSAAIGWDEEGRVVFVLYGFDEDNTVTTYLAEWDGSGIMKLTLIAAQGSGGYGMEVDMPSEMELRFIAADGVPSFKSETPVNALAMSFSIILDGVKVSELE